MFQYECADRVRCDAILNTPVVWKKTLKGRLFRLAYCKLEKYTTTIMYDRLFSVLTLGHVSYDQAVQYYPIFHVNKYLSIENLIIH